MTFILTSSLALKDITADPDGKDDKDSVEDAPKPLRAIMFVSFDPFKYKNISTFPDPLLWPREIKDIK